MKTLPETGFLRLWQILGDSRANPPVPPLIPVKKTFWWDGVRKKRFPQPIKLAPRVTGWKVEDIRAFIESGGQA